MNTVGWNYLLTEILLRMPTTMKKHLKLKNIFIKSISVTITFTCYFKETFK